MSFLLSDLGLKIIFLCTDYYVFSIEFFLTWFSSEKYSFIVNFDNYYNGSKYYVFSIEFFVSWFSSNTFQVHNEMTYNGNYIFSIMYWVLTVNNFYDILNQHNRNYIIFSIRYRVLSILLIDLDMKRYFFIITLTYITTMEVSVMYWVFSFFLFFYLDLKDSIHCICFIN